MAARQADCGARHDGRPAGRTSRRTRSHGHGSGGHRRHERPARPGRPRQRKSRRGPGRLHRRRRQGQLGASRGCPADEPFAGRADVTFPGVAWTQDISHGALVRAGNDQTLTIDPCRLPYEYQDMDPTAEGDHLRLPGGWTCSPRPTPPADPPPTHRSRSCHPLGRYASPPPC
ncbi:non-reducing end alpha-L-arabinofuranosidase family hydrolase [Streptomyces sp. NPDC053792]|uniref:non-reducing end alpha-L-arabinofuranosidase family hydrolase n=1 Tax=Streptomyces sp. NPDC053792 TaxID=3365716 RepID=UPI0037D57F9E